MLCCLVGMFWRCLCCFVCLRSPFRVTHWTKDQWNWSITLPFSLSSGLKCVTQHLIKCRTAIQHVCDCVYICICVYIHTDLARGYLSHVITPMMLYSVLCWTINLFQIEKKKIEWHMVVIFALNQMKTHVCVIAIYWSALWLSLAGTFDIHFSAFCIKILEFSFNKMHLKMSSTKWCLFCLGLNVLMNLGLWYDLFQITGFPWWSNEAILTHCCNSYFFELDPHIHMQNVQFYHNVVISNKRWADIHIQGWF